MELTGRLRCGTWACALLLILPAASLPARTRPQPVFASGPNDPVLTARIAALGPNVNPAEAQRVAFVAYSTGREFAQKWAVVWPPGLQNYLVLNGQRPGGLCFQWATQLLWRLHALHLQTLELHWAESFPNTASEHNVIVVTAKGQPFWQGILLDNWRYGGRLLWGPVNGDPHYEWRENKVAFARRLPRPPPPTVKTAKQPVKQKPAGRGLLAR